jgi:hypothetical protein
MSGMKWQPWLRGQPRSRAHERLTIADSTDRLASELVVTGEERVRRSEDCGCQVSKLAAFLTELRCPHEPSGALRDRRSYEKP